MAGRADGAKHHTFDHHVAVADGLAAAGLVDGSRIATRGLSPPVGCSRGRCSRSGRTGGGPLSPRCRSFTCLTTMLDPTIPLTVNEWDEWGDPRAPADYAWMARLLAVRQPAAGRRPPRPARHRRRARPAGHGLGAGQVGRRAARAPTPTWSPALPVPRRDRRRRPRRPVGPLRAPRLRGRGLRLAAVVGWGWGLGSGSALVAPGAGRPGPGPSPAPTGVPCRRRLLPAVLRPACLRHASLLATRGSAPVRAARRAAVTSPSRWVGLGSRAAAQPARPPPTVAEVRGTSFEAW